MCIYTNLSLWRVPDHHSALSECDLLGIIGELIERSRIVRKMEKAKNDSFYWSPSHLSDLTQDSTDGKEASSSSF